MNNEKFKDLMDEFYDANNLIELCRGYTQSDTPSIQTLSESLYTLEKKYEEIYAKLCTIDEVK